MDRKVDRKMDPKKDRKMDRKIETLAQIYELYDQTTGQFQLACRAGCDHCCTCNVTVTGLETAYLFSQLDEAAASSLKNRLEAAAKGPRYRPALTTNGFARATLAGEPVEEEENDPEWGRCPLLMDGRCSIYRGRPFGCRSMVSEISCRDQGWAQMPPLVLTLSTLFLQYIEHLDAGGRSGNFLDMAACHFAQGPAGDLPYENRGNSDRRKRFARNLHIPALMVPPEHRSQVASLVNTLNRLMQAVV